MLIHDAARSFDLNSPVLKGQCVVRERDIELTLNESTLEMGYDPGATVWSGACQVMSPKEFADIREGEMSLASDQVVVRLPRTAVGVDPQMIIEITDDPDPDLIGVEYEVRSPVERSFAATRAVICRRYRAKRSTRSVPAV